MADRKNFTQLLMPLRLMVVDDEVEITSVKDDLYEAVRKLDYRNEVISCSTTNEGKAELQLLRKQEKKVHCVAMDYRLSAGDKPRPFLVDFLNENPDAYWFWNSKNIGSIPLDDPELTEQENRLLVSRMLSHIHKQSKSLSHVLAELMDRLTKDLVDLSDSQSETKDLILTARPTLGIEEEWPTRYDGREISILEEKRKIPSGLKLSALDVLVPDCEIFDNAVIIHVPSLPANATCFLDGIIPYPSESRVGRVSENEQPMLREAWVGRKYFKSLDIRNALDFSGDFGERYSQKYITAFNINLLWLYAASKVNWSGSIFDIYGYENKKPLYKLADWLGAEKAGAIWAKIGPANIISMFRCWAAVYQELQAQSFFLGKNGSRSMKACDSRLPSKAASGEIKMMISPEARLFIDRGNHLYNLRTGQVTPIGIAEASPLSEATSRQNSSSSSNVPTNPPPASATSARATRTKGKYERKKKSTGKGGAAGRGHR